MVTKQFGTLADTIGKDADALVAAAVPVAEQMSYTLERVGTLLQAADHRRRNHRPADEQSGPLSEPRRGRQETGEHTSVSRSPPPEDQGRRASSWACESGTQPCRPMDKSTGKARQCRAFPVLVSITSIRGRGTSGVDHDHEFDPTALSFRAHGLVRPMCRVGDAIPWRRPSTEGTRRPRKHARNRDGGSFHIEPSTS